MNSKKLKAIYNLVDDAYEAVYSEVERREIAKILDTSAGQFTDIQIRNDLSILKDIDVIISGWGGSRIDQEFLNAAPNLKAIFYGAGSVRYMTTPEFWSSNIPITSAVTANSIPVAEYTLSQILFCLKLGWQHNHYRKHGQLDRLPAPGAFRSTVGLISMGAIAKRVRTLLKNHDIKVLAYDPYLSDEEAEEWEVELVSLDEIFARSSVVSLHSPDLPETKEMIQRHHIEAMLPWASFINTARSATVKHTELCDVLQKRPDLWAILDVTENTSEEEHKRLIRLPNVSLTPHIAGSYGQECYRMGNLVLEEIRRFANNEPLKYQISEERAKIMA